MIAYVINWPIGKGIQEALLLLDARRINILVFATILAQRDVEPGHSTGEYLESCISEYSTMFNQEYNKAQSAGCVCLDFPGSCDTLHHYCLCDGNVPQYLCKSAIHRCVCGKQLHSICKSKFHSCLCYISHFACKSHIHQCSCKTVGPKHCRHNKDDHQHICENIRLTRICRHVDHKKVELDKEDTPGWGR